LYDLNPNVEIETPENLTLEAEVAGFGSRSVAAIIDYLILFLVIVVVAVLFLTSIGNIGDNTTWLLAVFWLIQFSIITFYHLFFEFLWNGQTPGKRVFHLRVVQSNGLPATTSGLLIRNMVRLFDFMPICYGVGLLSMFFTRHTQRLGDLAARTIVIYERPQVSLQTLREDTRVPYFYTLSNEPIPPFVDITNLTEEDHLMVLAYLHRRTELVQREHIVVPMAYQIATTMGMADIRWLYYPHYAEKFLEQVARAFEIKARSSVPQLGQPPRF